MRPEKLNYPLKGALARIKSVNSFCRCPDCGSYLDPDDEMACTNIMCPFDSTDAMYLVRKEYKEEKWIAKEKWMLEAKVHIDIMTNDEFMAFINDCVMINKQA